jgi:hypothetical protein
MSEYEGLVKRAQAQFDEKFQELMDSRDSVANLFA